MGTYIGMKSTGPWTAEKRDWLLGPAGTQPGANPSVTLDVSAFTAGTHYPDGFIPSGTVVGIITASSTGGVLMVGPYDNAASDGRQTAFGLLFSSVTVPDTADTTQDVGGAVVIEGHVDPAKLPANSGLDTAARADLVNIMFAPVTP